MLHLLLLRRLALLLLGFVFEGLHIEAVGVFNRFLVPLPLLDGVVAFLLGLLAARIHLGVQQ